MSTSDLQPVQLRYRNFLLEAAAEEIADGEWSASFAVFTSRSLNAGLLDAVAVQGLCY
jgi:hypothetical protein